MTDDRTARREALIALRRQEQEAKRAAREEERAAILAARQASALAEREARSLAKDLAEAEALRLRILAPVPEVAGLPRVLLIGDSISIGYTLRVREILEEANVQRIPNNGGSTALGLTKLESWLGAIPWDAIHFNFGVHDAVQNVPGRSGVEIDQYAANLETIVARLKETGAQLIFATTTPNPAEDDRFGDHAAYNAAAVPIMQANGIAINDLYAAVLPRFAEYAMPRDVHFKPAGYHFLASRVAESIAACL
jgi:acyl-CoA thioesterase-1